MLLAPLGRPGRRQGVRRGGSLRAALLEAFTRVVGHAAVERGEQLLLHHFFLHGPARRRRPVLQLFRGAGEVRFAHALDQPLDFFDLFGPQVLFGGHVSLERVFDGVLVDGLAFRVCGAVEEDVHLQHSLVVSGEPGPGGTFHSYFSI